MDALIDAENLCKIFHAGSSVSVRALDGVTCSIPRGSFSMLLGPSGSGKTTLLSIFAALDRPTYGLIRFRDRTLNECSDAELARLRRRMGVVFQNHALISRLPVWENITYPLIPRGASTRERRCIAQQFLERLFLSEKFSVFPHELSGGEQQRVALARALAGKPELILCDEPLSNLDVENSQVVLDMLQEVHAHGTTVILATHDLSLVPRATDVIELNAGKLSRHVVAKKE